MARGCGLLFRRRLWLLGRLYRSRRDLLLTGENLTRCGGLWILIWGIWHDASEKGMYVGNEG